MHRCSCVSSAIALAMIAGMTMSGCVAALAPAAAAAQAAGSGVAFWDGNKLKQAIPAPVEDVSDAFDEVAADLHLTLADDDSTRAGNRLESRVIRVNDDDERLCVVRMEHMTDGLTYVVMEARLFGKRAVVSLLMEELRARAVAESPPEPSQDHDPT